MGDAHATHDHSHAGHAHDGHAHGHDPNLAHHFDTMDQQVEACKLGMWLFLATEVLLFAGLFCAYTVYRSNHPEIFVYASQYLSKFWGGVNTIILLLSSFTVALAVRCASLGQQKQTLIYLALTILGAFGFMAVKTIEYRDKFAHGTLWGVRYNPHGEPPGHHETTHQAVQPILPEAGADVNVRTPWEGNQNLQGSLSPNPSNVIKVETHDGHVDPAAVPEAMTAAEIKNVHLFFGIYFVMTGLHGLHVIIGALAIGWVMLRTARGEFSPSYYLPVDLVGLYWHLVDLIWIYLFPLLYLIG
jgi:cytochrome c oxidase subunit III